MAQDSTEYNIYRVVYTAASVVHARTSDEALEQFTMDNITIDPTDEIAARERLIHGPVIRYVEEMGSFTVVPLS